MLGVIGENLFQSNALIRLMVLLDIPTNFWTIILKVDKPIILQRFSTSEWITDQFSRKNLFDRYLYFNKYERKL